MTKAEIVVCNGPQKAGTHALLQLAEAMGYPKYAFLRAIRSETAYARHIDYGADSVFLSDTARDNYADYLAADVKFKGDDAAAFAFDRPPGFTGAVHSHVSWGRRDILQGQTVLTVLRHPRNTFLSWKKWMKGPESHFFAAYRSFLDWGKRPQDCFFLETLFSEPELKRLARRIGYDIRQEGVDALIHKAYGKSLTWSDAPSSFRQNWSDADEQLWERHNGVRLEKKYKGLLLESLQHSARDLSVKRIRDVVGVLVQ